jgi:hypothetical protein
LEKGGQGGFSDVSSFKMKLPKLHNLQHYPGKKPGRIDTKKALWEDNFGKGG